MNNIFFRSHNCYFLLSALIALSYALPELAQCNFKVGERCGCFVEPREKHQFEPYCHSGLYSSMFVMGTIKKDFLDYRWSALGVCQYDPDSFLRCPGAIAGHSVVAFCNDFAPEEEQKNVVGCCQATGCSKCTAAGQGLCTECADGFESRNARLYKPHENVIGTTVMDCLPSTVPSLSTKGQTLQSTVPPSQHVLATTSMEEEEKGSVQIRTQHDQTEYLHTNGRLGTSIWAKKTVVDNIHATKASMGQFWTGKVSDYSTKESVFVDWSILYVVITAGIVCCMLFIGTLAALLVFLLRKRVKEPNLEDASLSTNKGAPVEITNNRKSQIAVYDLAPHPQVIYEPVGEPVCNQYDSVHAPLQ